jgi:hypothetical protein
MPSARSGDLILGTVTSLSCEFYQPLTGSDLVAAATSTIAAAPGYLFSGGSRWPTTKC